MLKSELKHRAVTQSRADVAFDQEFDVIVIGAGTSGAVSAAMIAEHGLSVCCIEKLNMVGGTATAGGISCYYYGLTGGWFESVDREEKQLREGEFIDGHRFHGDLKGFVLERKILDHGGVISFDSSITAVYLDDDGKTARGVRAITPEGVRDLGCKILLDGTGDGQVCALAGCEFTEGRAADGKPQPASSVRIFRRGNQLAHANFDAGYALSSDAADMNRAMLAFNSLHRKPVGETPDTIYSISPLIGLREGRLIVCDETATFAGFMAHKPLKGRTLAYAYSNFDSHSQDWAMLDEMTRDWMVCASMWGKNFTVPITLGMMLPKNFHNLAVLGRALSVDHMMACLIRMQPCLQKQAEVVARAVVAAIGKGVLLRSINPESLEAELRESGCLNDEEALPDCSFPEEPKVLKELLCSTKPGEAIWVTSRNLAKYRPLLMECLGSADHHACSNAAIALGVAKDSAGLEELRKIIRRNDDFLPESGRSHNQPRILAAIDLLGRLGNEDDVELLQKLMLERKEEVQIFTHSFRALLEAGDRFVSFRAGIRNTVANLFEKEKFECLLLMKNSSNLGERVNEPLNDSLKKLAKPYFDRWETP